MYYQTKKHFYSYSIEKNYKDNQLLYYKQMNHLLIEVRYWKGFYEVFYRPQKKIYGYFFNRYDDLQKAVNCVNNFSLYKNLV